MTNEEAKIADALISGRVDVLDTKVAIKLDMLLDKVEALTRAVEANTKWRWATMAVVLCGWPVFALWVSTL